LDEGSTHRKVSTYTGQNKTDKRGYTFMCREGFEPRIPVLEKSKIILTN